jgi:tRNA A-37 threonylcarbamoyl transferase component Bud32
VFVIAKHQDLLHQLGLDTMDGVKQFKGELIKNHKGQRDIQRISRVPTTQQVISPTLFLKRNWRPYKKDGLNSLFTRGQVWSQSRVEWENSLALQRAGIDVAEPVAFGEECGPLWEKFSFILTAAAMGEMTMDDFLRTVDGPSERKVVFDELARQIRKMHDAGLASPDLFTRHIFIARGNLPKFCLIDMARMDQRRTLPDSLRGRDLAALHVTAPLRFVSTPERQRFLEVYGASAELRELISQRVAHLLTRRKFADFSAK